MQVQTTLDLFVLSINSNMESRCACVITHLWKGRWRWKSVPKTKLHVKPTEPHRRQRGKGVMHAQFPQVSLNSIFSHVDRSRDSPPASGINDLLLTIILGADNPSRPGVKRLIAAQRLISYPVPQFACHLGSFASHLMCSYSSVGCVRVTNRMVYGTDLYASIPHASRYELRSLSPLSANPLEADSHPPALLTVPL